MTFVEPELDDLRRVAGAIDREAVLVGARPLPGGVSAQVLALDLRRGDGAARTVVLRRHGAADLRANPNVAADEFRLLRLLSDVRLPVPKPLLVDQTGALLSSPFVVVAFVDGEVRLDPPNVDAAVDAMAAQLAAIHRIDAAQHDLAFLPRQEERVNRVLAHPPAELDASMGEGRIREALVRAWTRAPVGPPVLLHGDYWLGNLLWRGDAIAGVLDWEDAAVGSPLADVGNARLELLWAWGEAAMRRFTDRYATVTGVDLVALPAWDLCAALRPAGKLAGWGLEAEVEARMREWHARFVEEAIVSLDP